jgi:hypothetical protein
VILKLHNAGKPVQRSEILRIARSGEQEAVSSLGFTGTTGLLVFSPGDENTPMLARKTGNALEYFAPSQLRAGTLLDYDLAGNESWLHALARARRLRNQGASLFVLLQGGTIARAAGRILLADGKTAAANAANNCVRWLPAADPGSLFAFELNSGSILVRRSLRDEAHPLHEVISMNLQNARAVSMNAAGNVWLPGVDGFSMQAVRPDTAKNVNLLLDCAHGFGIARDAGDIQSAPGREFSLDDFVAVCEKIAAQCRFNAKYALIAASRGPQGQPAPATVIQVFGGTAPLTLKTSGRGTLLAFIPRGDKPQYACSKADGLVQIKGPLPQQNPAILRLDAAAEGAAVIRSARAARQALYVYLPDGTAIPAITDAGGVLRLHAPAALTVSRTRNPEQGLSVTPGAELTLP